MRKLTATNTHDFFALLSCIILILASFCESKRNINNDVLRQAGQPQQLRHHVDVDKESHPPPTSPGPKGSHLIGLDVNGRVKCLLWNNPRKSIDSTLLPLFSSPYKYEHIVDEGRHYHGTKSCNQTLANNIEETKQRRPVTLFLPSAVYGTADYRFRKARWYGVEKIGAIFRWNFPGVWPLCNDNNDRNEDLRHAKSRSFRLPTILDIAAYRSISNPSKADTKTEVPSIIDSGHLCIAWDKGDDKTSFGIVGVNPRIQFGFEQKFPDADDDLQMISNSKEKWHPFYARFFLPLIHKRFDLQWTSRWGDLSTHLHSERNTERESETGNQWSSDHREPNGDPWWIPQVNLDPSTGMLTSENRHRNILSGKGDGKYFTEFRVRLRTTMPTLLSSVANNAMPTYDEDDLEAASLRFEYSLLTGPGKQKRPFQGAARTTARFETILVPSFWLRSITETARFGFAHEQRHSTNI